MVLNTRTRWVTLATALAFAAPAAAAHANPAGPPAHAAGDGAAPVNPAIVGVPIQRTDDALANAADAIDAGNGAAAVGPAIADPPTAVFNVLTSQYNAATAAVDMAPDTTGNLLAKVQTTLNTAIVLRNRLVKVVHTAAPPAPAEAGRVHAHASQAVAGEFDAVMPGLVVLIDDELQQMKAASQDSSTPADVKTMLTSAISADNQIEALVNQFWPPAPAAD